MNCIYDYSTMSCGRDRASNDELEQDDIPERCMGNSQKAKSASQSMFGEAQEVSATSLELLRRRLAEAERAHALLLEKGYGRSWMPLEEIAKLVPKKNGEQGNR